MNVKNIILGNDICIGCGMCAYICPLNMIKMKFNEYGEYKPNIEDDCINCGLCLEVCPFYYKSLNEDELSEVKYAKIENIKYLDPIGYYLNTYVGYSMVNDHRKDGASGGLTTWILENLLSNGIVDYIICVSTNSNPKKLYKYKIFNNIESIRESSGSAYYPIEMSEILKKVKNKEAKYAVVGLPCFIKAMDLVKKKDKLLNERILLNIGLVCGQLKNTQFTSYIAKLAGIKNDIKKVKFRNKSKAKLANNYFYRFSDINGNKKEIFWNEGINKIWINRWFTLGACNYCDDIFAEIADVTLMDAWLAEYEKNWEGTNLLIVRNPLIDKLLNNGVNEDQINIKKISIKEIIKSQLGTINIKRKQISYRLYLVKGISKMPIKRIRLNKKINFFIKKEIKLKDQMQKISKKLFNANCNLSEIDIDYCESKMIPFLNKLKKWENINRVINLPKLIISKIIRGSRNLLNKIF